MADRRWVVAAGVALLVALVALRAPSFLTQKREVIASTPTPNAINAVTPVEVKPGVQACMQQVTFSADSQMARVVVVGLHGRTTPPLALTASGPGYRFATAVRGGYSAAAPLEMPLRAPARSLIGQLCLKNRGGASVLFGGTLEGRTIGRSPTFLNGVQQSAYLSLTLHRRAPRALIGRTPQVFARAAMLDRLPAALIWVLALAVLVGAPVAVFWALAAAMGAGTAPLPDTGVGAPPVPLARHVRRLRPPVARARARVAALPAGVALAAVVVLAAAWFFVWAQRTHTFQNDESMYVYVARWINTGLPDSLWNFTVIQTGLQRLEIFLLTPIVGALPGPEWAWAGHAVNTLLFATAAVPIYLVARGMGVPGRWAVLAGALTVVVPWAVVTTSFLTEPVAYPAFAWAVWAIWRAAVRPSWRADALAVALVALAGLARVNLLALGAVLAAAVVVQELRYGRWRSARGARPRAIAFVRGFGRAHPVLVAIGVIALGALALNATGHFSALDRVTGSYGTANRFHVPLRLFAAKLDLYTTRFVAGIAFVPFAFGLAWIVRSAARPTDPARFAFAAVALMAIAVIIYTSAGAGSDERYLIYYAPLFACAFAAALATREARPLLVAAAGILGAVLLLRHTWSAAPAGGYSWFVAPAETTYANSFLARLARDVPGSIDVRVAAFVLELGLVAICVAAARRRATPRLVSLLVAGVVVVQLFQTGDALSKFVNGAGSRAAANLSQRSWIDNALYGKSHAAIFASAQGNNTSYDPIWAEVQFWNDSLSSVVTLGYRYIQVPPSDTYAEAGVDPKTGRLTGSPIAPYLVVARGWLGLGLDTKPVAQAPYLAIDLVRLQSRQVLWTADGAQIDGFMTPKTPVRVRVFRAAATRVAPACAHVDVTAPFGFNGRRRVSITDGRVRRTIGVLQAKAQRLAIPLPATRAAYSDLTLTAAGSTKLADGRDASVQISGIGVERCGG